MTPGFRQHKRSLTQRSVDPNSPRASPCERGIDSTSCWGSSGVTLLTRMWDGEYCHGHFCTTHSVLSSMCGRKVGINAPGAILNQGGGNWWINAGPLSFRGTILTYIGQVLQGIPNRIETQMPTVELAQQCPLIVFSSFPVFISPSLPATSSKHLPVLVLGFPLLRNHTKTLSFSVRK